MSNAQVLADALGMEMPDLPDVGVDEPSAGGEGMIRGIGAGGRGAGGVGEEFVPGGIWNDEEERRFYEDIIDLKDRVPPTLLEDATKGTAPADRGLRRPSL